MKEVQIEKPTIRTDRVTLEVVRNYLETTCREMGVVMMRTSYSPIFNESLDFTCVIFDAKPELVAQAEFIPAHIGAIKYAVEWIIKEVGPENMRPGEVWFNNDPYRGGCHLPECCVVKPMFYNGEIVAYTANVAHHIDIGGTIPTGFGALTSIF
ncbi:MAG: hydantoinase B/oxoprolinase family protein, partial [Candidatus Bathyarchaeia archaeon]